MALNTFSIFTGKELLNLLKTIPFKLERVLSIKEKENINRFYITGANVSEFEADDIFILYIKENEITLKNITKEKKVNISYIYKV